MSDLLSQPTDTFRNFVRPLASPPAKPGDGDRAPAEPIAVIGMACRFPGGAHTPEQLWSLLEQGKDATSCAPAGRWPGPNRLDPSQPATDKANFPRGGFLDGDLYGFDAAFFGLTPAEALAVDPQRRLLLEVAWEALENAGLDAPALRGTHTGVFTGVSGFDYAKDPVPAATLTRLEAGSVTGIASDTGPGRISRVLGLAGPSLAVDTAGSSSLVAVHLACQSLRGGESCLALAGGVHLMPTPEIIPGSSPLKAVSPAGYTRGEGCGILVLQRLADALKDGHPVLALIVGSAVNQEARAAGSPAPDGRARQHVIHDALRRAGLPAAAVQYVEAPGAGTPLGDPLEIQPLADVYRGERAARAPLWFGSITANFGQLEAAAGGAGLIKTILQLRHRTLCPQIQPHRPNPCPPGRALPIPNGLTAWPDSSWARVAAVSAFGSGGTNAQVILREASPAPAPAATAANRPAHLLVLSARNPAGLKAMADQYAALLDRCSALEDPGAGDLCFSAATTRTGFGYRLAVLGKTKAELGGKLRQWATGQAGAGVWSSPGEPSAPPRLAFLFTGQGSQYRHMGRDLWESQPVFQAVLKQCDEILKPHLDFRLLDLLYNPATPDEQLHQTIHTQPVIFAFGYALAKMWESWGVTPSVVLGHSIGEVAAACFAGVIALEDALGLVALRGRLIHRATLPGTMGAIVAPVESVAAAIRELGGQVGIAAINAPENVVISGNTADVQRILEHFKSRDIPAMALRISHAIHSPLMDPILDEYTAAAARLSFSLPRIPLISNLTGRLAGEEITRPDYWRRQLRQTVNFRACLETLRDAGCQIALETGATSILSNVGLQCLPGANLLWLHSLGLKNSLANMRPQRIPGRSDWETILDTLGQLYARGTNLNWKEIDRGFAWRRVRLPNYPFQKPHCRMG